MKKGEASSFLSKESFRDMIIFFYRSITINEVSVNTNTSFSPSGIERNAKCCIITCYDPRIDAVMTHFTSEIRLQGGLLDTKDIQRPPGGAYLTAGDPRCRDAFYRTIAAFHDIAKIRHFFFLPHTDCVFCRGDYRLKRKIAKCDHGDLQFHLDAAEKLVEGSMKHFSRIEESSRPTVSAGIILTDRQEIVTLEHARRLLPTAMPQVMISHHILGNPHPQPQVTA